MNDDLISRSELKKAVEKYRPKSTVKSIFLDGLHCMFMDCLAEIDNAPTVEIDVNDIEYNAYCKGLEDGKKIARPHGKWVFDSEFPTFGNPYGTHKCSCCGGHSSSKYLFCKDCGAYMGVLRDEEIV